ncbi:hypothetical protein ABKV85_23045, partial (plasmid) [Enterobacter hormaechei]
PLKFNRRVSDGFRGGLLWFLSWFRQERAERVSGGAGNGCYGKSVSAADIKKPPGWRLAVIFVAFLHLSVFL